MQRLLLRSYRLMLDSIWLGECQELELLPRLPRHSSEGAKTTLRLVVYKTESTFTVSVLQTSTSRLGTYVESEPVGSTEHLLLPGHT